MRFGGPLLVFVLAFAAVAPGPVAPPAFADAPGAAAKDHPPAADSGGVDLFKGFTETAVWTVVVFLALLYILTRFAWKPMMEGLAKREERISSAVEEARQIKVENEKLKAEMKAEIQKAHEQVRELMDEARKDAQQARERMIADAQEKIAEDRQRLLGEMAREREGLYAAVFGQAAELATLISGKAIRKNLTLEDHQRLSDEALAELRDTLKSNGQKV